MKKYNKRVFKRNDNKDIFIYGYKKHTEKSLKQLDITISSSPHMRWHPLRNEWVTYSENRKLRTSFPKDKYCPFCPSGRIKYPTEIPFNEFDIAVFPNRWPSFNFNKKNLVLKNTVTRTSKGSCEVVVYSDKHSDTVAEMSLKRLELLINVWIDRYRKLYKLKGIKYVMPFENRGKECGVTLSHPHGQIYAYPFIPPVIKKEMNAFRKKNYLLEIINKFKKKYTVYENNDMVAVIPPYARYAYEVWIIPKKKIAGPWDFNQKQIKSYAECIKKIIKGYDSFLKRKCPYIMGLHAAPSIKNKSFHFHTEFYPPLRSGDKPKILAGSESMAGVFIMDVLPEESVKILREHIK